MQNSGKLLIIAMLLVGVLAGGVSWWFRYSATHRAALFWGPEGARLIRDGARVELLRLKHADSPEQHEELVELQEQAQQDEQKDGAPKSRPEQVRVGGELWTIVERRDGSRARGLTHLRTALLDDRSYDWSRRAAPEEIDDVEWRHALRFMADGDSDGGPSEIVVLVAEDFDWITSGRLLDGGGENPAAERASNRDEREAPTAHAAGDVRPAHASGVGTMGPTKQRSGKHRAVSAEPIAPGLEEVFGEWMGEATPQ